MTFGYIRVSTDKQTVLNQRFEILEFAKENNLTIDEWIEETVSGTRSPDSRRLGFLMQKVVENDLIVCSELSRLGRSLFMIMSILNRLMEKGVRVWTVKEGYKLGDDIQSKVLAFAFGLSAEIERNLISQRTKEALAARKAKGKNLGRKKGARVHRRLDGYEKEIRLMRSWGLSENMIAKKLGVSRTILHRVLEDDDGEIDSKTNSTFSATNSYFC